MRRYVRISEKELRRKVEHGIPVSKIAGDHGYSKPAIYRALRQLGIALPVRQKVVRKPVINPLAERKRRCLAKLWHFQRQFYGLPSSPWLGGSEPSPAGTLKSAP